MLEYVINVTEIEELQTIKNMEALDHIFVKAERTVIGGGVVFLVRQQANGKKDKFDELSTEEDLKTYKEGVYKYLHI